MSQTALLAAVEDRDYDKAETLLKQGADPERQALRRQFYHNYVKPIDFAAFHLYPEMVELLLRYSSNNPDTITYMFETLAENYVRGNPSRNFEPEELKDLLTIIKLYINTGKLRSRWMTRINYQELDQSSPRLVEVVDLFLTKEVYQIDLYTARLAHDPDYAKEFDPMDEAKYFFDEDIQYTPYVKRVMQYFRLISMKYGPRPSRASLRDLVVETLTIAGSDLSYHSLNQCTWPFTPVECLT